MSTVDGSAIGSTPLLGLKRSGPAIWLHPAGHVVGALVTACSPVVADHLVQANLAGHDSHGVGMMPSYVRHLKAGLVVPNTRAKCVKDDGPTLMFDGGRGYGRAVAGEAVAAGIARCLQTGVVAMTLANAHHIGRVGAYGELASGAGLVSLHFVNVTDHRAVVAPFPLTEATAPSWSALLAEDLKVTSTGTSGPDGTCVGVAVAVAREIGRAARDPA